MGLVCTGDGNAPAASASATSMQAASSGSMDPVFIGQNALPAATGPWASPVTSFSSTASREQDMSSTRTSERAKFACLACRKDNKKCDDQRPCSRCVARGHADDCVHLPRTPKTVALRCDGCRADNKRCEETKPCSHCVAEGKECTTSPRKGRSHGERVKAACVNCRRDKIRCDGERPCTSCTRKRIECVDNSCQACSKRDIRCVHVHRRTSSTASTDLDLDHGEMRFIEEPYSTLSSPSGNPKIVHSTLPVNGHHYPQWTALGPGPHSHPLHPLYPTTMPQPQYYFPPRHVIDPDDPPFPLNVGRSSIPKLDHVLYQQQVAQYPPFLSDGEVFTRPWALNDRTHRRDDYQED